VEDRKLINLLGQLEFVVLVAPELQKRKLMRDNWLKILTWSAGMLGQPPPTRLMTFIPSSAKPTRAVQFHLFEIFKCEPTLRRSSRIHVSYTFYEKEERKKDGWLVGSHSRTFPNHPSGILSPKPNPPPYLPHQIYIRIARLV
jgi:hypothetical protein